MVTNMNYPADVVNLATSFCCRLSNAAHIVVIAGSIVTPGFFRATECWLQCLDDLVEHFRDGRKGFGCNFETEAACRDLLVRRTQSDTLRWADSIRFQHHMAAVREHFAPG